MLSYSSFTPRNELFRKCFVPALVVILVICGSVSAEADYFDIVPSLGVKQQYNDNLFFTADKTGDFITTFTPGVELQKKTERLDARLFTSITGVKYWRKSMYDTADYSFLGNAQYQLSPRFDLAVSAEYDRISTPDRILGPLATVLGTLREYRQLYSLRNEYRFTEKTSGIAAYSYTQNDYVMVPVQSSTVQTVTFPPVPPIPPPNPPPPGGNPGGGNPGPTPGPATQILSSSDVNIHAPSLGLVHKLDERTKVSVNAGYTRFDYTYSTVDNYELTVGLTRALNELWNVSLSGGGRYTSSVFTPVQRTFTSPVQFTDTVLPQETDESWGWIGQCALSYNGIYWGGSLSFFRDVYQGRLSANETTGVILDLKHKFTYEMEGNFSAGYQYDRAGSGEFGSNPVSDQVMRFGVGLRYDFTKDVSLDGGYALNLDRISGLYITQNYAYANLVVKCPMFQ